MNKLIIYCDILNPLSDTKAELIKDGYLLIDKELNGQIISYGKSKDFVFTEGSYQVLDRTNMTAIPGFFDMHFHWVQDDVRLKPKASLLEWLSKYTWPYEKKFSSRDYSKKRSDKFAKELLSVGTLGGAVYCSIHGHTVDDALNKFVGHYIAGNVLMTMNSPSYLTQTKKNALSLVKRLSTKYKNLYAMTPRFAPTTHPDVMKESAKIAKQNKSFIQTHLSETPGECEYVLSLYRDIKGFEKVKNYTEIYKKTSVLGSRTIMGHGIYLDKSELETLSKTKTSIAHCPTSNAPVKEFGLGSGLFDFKMAEKYKVNWALGSDIGGGPFLSMFDVMKSFVDQNAQSKRKGATYIKALYRSTLMGAKLLKLDKVTGNFAVKKEANFFFVKSNNEKTAEKFLKSLTKVKNRKTYSTFVQEVYFRGKLVFKI